MLVYKICTQALWDDAQKTGVVPGMPIDLADGYIHFSTAEQLSSTVAKYFAGQTGLMLLTVDIAPLKAGIRWEPARGGDLFPHLYAPLPVAHVTQAAPFSVSADGAIQP